MAAYVAVLNPDLRAVTVNPAPVPAGFANRLAPNVWNYISTDTDPLYRALMAGGLGDRIIGSVIDVAGTRAGSAFLAENHVGSERLGGTYDASMGVPFSLFHEDVIVGPGDFGTKIDVTPEVLAVLVEGLASQRDDLEMVFSEKLPKVKETLTAFIESGARREAGAKESYRDALTSVVRPAVVVLDVLEVGVEGLKAGLRSLDPPGPLNWVWDTGVEMILEPLDQILLGVREVIGFEIIGVAEMIWMMQVDAFEAGSRAIGGELLGQCEELQWDSGVVKGKWDTVITYVTDIGSSLSQVDTSVAAAIAAGTCLPGAIVVGQPSWPDGQVDQLQGSASVDVCQWSMSVRDDVAMSLMTSIAVGVSARISFHVCGLLGGALLALETLEGVFGSASSLVRGAIKVASFNPL